MQVEAEAQAAHDANSLHFLTTTSLPTVGELTPDLLIPSRRTAQEYHGCCHCWCQLFTLRAALQLR